MNRLFSPLGLWLALSALPLPALAAESGTGPLDLTGSGFGVVAIIAFIVAYIVVIGEEFLHLRKSKPVVIAAGVIWALVGVAYAVHGDDHTAAEAVRHNLQEYAELFLFLLAAMTYINTLEERQLFNALRAWLVSRGFSLVTVFWITGLLAFFISPIADNLTTALLMAAVVTAVGIGQNRFVALACINIVVAANAGGAFSPFGDITTLLVWQKGVIKFHEFFDLFLPSLVNWLIPALLMSFAVPKGKPAAMEEQVEVKFGGYVVTALFIGTIAMAEYNLNVGIWWLIWPIILQGFGMGLVFVPLTTLAFATLRPDQTAEAAGLRHGYRLQGPVPDSRSLIGNLQKTFAERENRDTARLRGVLAYAEQNRCLTRHLLDYFGEEGASDCEDCSRCRRGKGERLPRTAPLEPGVRETEIAQRVKAENHQALTHPRQLARFLCGITSPAATRARLNRHPDFGALAEIPFRRVLGMVE